MLQTKPTCVGILFRARDIALADTNACCLQYCLNPTFDKPVATTPFTSADVFILRDLFIQLPSASFRHASSVSMTDIIQMKNKKVSFLGFVAPTIFAVFVAPTVVSLVFFVVDFFTHPGAAFTLFVILVMISLVMSACATLMPNLLAILQRSSFFNPMCLYFVAREKMPPSPEHWRIHKSGIMPRHSAGAWRFT